MTKKYKSGGTFIEREMLESEAYLSLKGFAPQLLSLILLKRQFQNHGRKGKQKRVCINCDNITMTYIELKKKYRITQPRATRAFDQLLEKGFLCVVNPGGGYQRDKAIYSLSNNWTIWHNGCSFNERKKQHKGFCSNKTQHT